MAEQVRLVIDSTLVGRAERKAGCRTEFEADGGGNRVLVLVPAEVQHIVSLERCDDISFVEDVVSVHFNDRADPFVNLVVGVEVPAKMVRVAEWIVSVVGGEEIVRGCAEVEASDAFVDGPPQANFIVVLKDFVVTGGKFV